MTDLHDWPSLVCSECLPDGTRYALLPLDDYQLRALLRNFDRMPNDGDWHEEVKAVLVCALVRLDADTTPAGGGK